ncbi:hypothetical protein EVAR_43296_1 [Eumeta japonica]|uniref:Uncharacterized protein n=1 Tax=Eumeta variegata TaxID=151549 RepID=A0A4C1X207_EUMVA|nr:hypothetical protein EVAR_43296_1 [Eumeta japonica]
MKYKTDKKVSKAQCVANFEKAIKSAEVEEYLRESDDDVFVGSDVDDIDYIADEWNESSESKEEEREEEVETELPT